MFDRLVTRLAHRMVRPIQAIIRQEIRPMVDAVADLTAQTDATLAGLAALVAVAQKDNTAAIEAQVVRLKEGTDAAAAALAALNPPAEPAPTEPAPEEPAPTV